MMSLSHRFISLNTKRLTYKFVNYILKKIKQRSKMTPTQVYLFRLIQNIGPIQSQNTMKKLVMIPSYYNKIATINRNPASISQKG